MSFIKNIWYVAAWNDEVVAGEPRGCVIADTPVVIYRRADGAVVALEDRCSHRCAPLSKGRVEGDAVRCWYHGLLFGQDGVCLEMPGQDTIPPGFDIRHYPVAVSQGWVWIWLGDADRADTSLIPNCRLDEGGLDYRTGYLNYDANYELINDNLCDLSHVAYVHEKTLSRDATDWVQRKATHTNLENGVAVSRWITYSQPLPLPNLPERVDIWSSYEFYLPGVMSLNIQYYPVGTAEKCDYVAPPEGKPIFALRNVHGMTPINDSTTRYHYGVSLPINPCGDGALDMGIAMVTQAFTEDKDMIEDQQRMLDLYPGVILRNTVHDTALMRIRRMIANRIKQEQEAASAA